VFTILTYKLSIYHSILSYYHSNTLKSQHLKTSHFLPSISPASIVPLSPYLISPSILYPTRPSTWPYIYLQSNDRQLTDRQTTSAGHDKSINQTQARMPLTTID